MKTIKSIVTAIVMIALVGLVGCQKEIIETDNLSKTQVKLMPENVTFIANTHDIEDYITNHDDKDDEKISHQLLNLGLLSRDLFIDNLYNNVIFDNASKNANQTIGLVDFINKIQLDNKNNAELINAINNLDLSHASMNPVNKGQIENYIPAIFVPNIEIADATKQPIISSGIEVNSEIKGLEKYEDYIIAWYFEDGNWVEFLLNEDTAMKTSNPIFIIDNAEEEMTKREKVVMDYIPNETKSWQRYYSHRYKINYRYETIGQSDLYITGAHISSFGTYGLYADNNGTFHARKELANVRKSYIGDWRWHYQLHSEGSNFDYTFWNTYERDWNRSYKTLGDATRYGRTVSLKGRRKYTSEWYAYTPSALNTNPLTKTSYKYYTNWKGGYLVEDN